MTSSYGNIFHVTGLLCGNSPITDGFPAQRPVTRSFDVFFDLRLNKRLGKQSWGWWFETPLRSLWRHRNDARTGTSHYHQHGLLNQLDMLQSGHGSVITVRKQLQLITLLSTDAKIHLADQQIISNCGAATHSNRSFINIKQMAIHICNAVLISIDTQMLIQGIVSLLRKWAHFGNLTFAS